MRRFPPSFLVVALLLSPSMALSASDWVEDESLNTNTRIPAQFRRTSRPSANGLEGELQPGPGSDDEHAKHPARTMHSTAGQPLKGGVSHWGKTLRLSPRSTFSALAARDVLLQNAPILPPPKDHSISSGVFKSWLKNTNPAFAAALSQNILKDQIFDVKGSWDNSGHILRSLGIPFTRVGADALTKLPYDKVKVLVIDCGANLSLQAQRCVNKFVSEGGFLLTTDWALDSCLRPCFPGYVAWNGGYTEAQVVDAVAVGQDQTLFRGVVSPAYWKLEEKSQMVQILNPEVDVLVLSRQLKRQDPSQAGILSLTFRFGQGRVLHLVGHFDNNPAGAFTNVLPDPSPDIIVSLRQAIATNFIANAFAAAGETNRAVADQDATK